MSKTLKRRQTKEEVTFRLIAFSYFADLPCLISPIISFTAAPTHQRTARARCQRWRHLSQS